MPSRFRWVIIASALCVATLSAAPARSENCGELWHARNSIFAEAGYCFQTPRAIKTFGTRCYAPYGQLTASQTARVEAIIAQEGRLGCTGAPELQPAAQDPQAPPPLAQEPPAPAIDKRLSEAAAVWNVTKDTQSPAILESFISRFGDTAFGDMARARLEEVKKPAKSAATPAKDPGDVEPAEVDMCPRYIPAAGKIVQVPCEH